MHAVLVHIMHNNDYESCHIFTAKEGSNSLIVGLAPPGLKSNQAKKLGGGWPLFLFARPCISWVGLSIPPSFCLCNGIAFYCKALDDPIFCMNLHIFPSLHGSSSFQYKIKQFWKLTHCQCKLAKKGGRNSLMISKEQWIKDLTPASVYSNILSVSLHDPSSIYCPAPFSDLSEQ